MITTSTKTKIGTFELTIHSDTLVVVRCNDLVVNRIPAVFYVHVSNTDTGLSYKHFYLHRKGWVDCNHRDLSWVARRKVTDILQEILRDLFANRKDFFEAAKLYSLKADLKRLDKEIEEKTLALTTLKEKRDLLSSKIPATDKEV